MIDITEIDVLLEVLNDLYEENKNLKKENAKFDILIKNNQLAYMDLEKENEKLKKELHKLKLVNEMLSMDFSNSEHELLRENEQLRKEVEDLKQALIHSAFDMN